MRTPARQPASPARAPVARSGRQAAPATRATAVAALQRAIGNRALARWIKHPDAEKKGVVVPDVSAAEYDRFNPPKNE
jgi:hypothetical protein